MYYSDMGISTLLGKTLVKIEGAEVRSDVINFEDSDGKKYRMYHQQDCCEYVRLYDVIGNIDDLIGSPILEAEESSNSDDSHYNERHTWTFYKLGTIKGSVTLRWLGESNGYYSEAVYFTELEN